MGGGEEMPRYFSRCILRISSRSDVSNARGREPLHRPLHVPDICPKGQQEGLDTQEEGDGQTQMSRIEENGWRSSGGSVETLVCSHSTGIGNFTGMRGRLRKESLLQTLVRQLP